MSSTNETKKPNPAAETAEEQAAAPDTAAEQTVQGDASQADKEPKAEGKPEKEKKDWFGKKNRELEAVQAKLDAAEAKNGELKDQLLRTAAEYDNYRKRTAREADMKFNDGVSHAVTQILGILDTLDIGWKLLGMLPREELDRIDTKVLDQYYKPADTMKE